MSSEADIKMEIAVGRMLRTGVSAAAAVIFAGWMLYLVQAHGAAPDYRHFHGQPLTFRSIGTILDGVFAFHSRSVLDIGILTLIATPFARVILCVVDFALQKDKLYVLVSSIVLTVLVYSFFFHY